MTMGDKQMQEKIILRFKQDSEEDSTLLKQCLIQDDVQKTRLVIHRLAGRLAQIGAKALALAFRKMEVRVAQESIDIVCREDILRLLMDLDTLLSEIEADHQVIP